MSRMVQLAAAYTLLQAMSGFAVVDRALYGEWSDKGGDKLTVLMNCMSIVTSVFLVFAGYRRLGAVRLRQYVPFTAVGLLFLSAAWSVDPNDTIRRGINYAVLVVGAMGMAQALSPIQIMRLTVWVCVIAALASLALYPTPLGVLANPDTGMADFRGVFSYKNMLGEAMVAGFLAALYCIRAEHRARVAHIALAIFFLLIILAAKSATSLVTCICYVVVLIILALYAKGGTARFVSFCALGLAVVAALVLVIAPDVAFQALGKDATLTGRTELWPYVMIEIADKPLLGWGFNGFWSMSNPIAMSISEAVGWYVPESHNGLLELLLQVGFLGTAVFLGILVWNCHLAVTCMRQGDRSIGETMVLFVVGLFLMAISEAILLTPSQIPTLQFFLFGFMCETNATLTSLRRQRRGGQQLRVPVIRPVSIRPGAKA